MSISKFHFETFPATSKFEILDTCRHLDCDPPHQHIRLFRILFTNFLEFTQIPVPCRDHGDTEERRHGRSGARRDWQKPEITECFTRMQ